MEKFLIRINELLKDENIIIIAENLNINSSIIYQWKNGSRLPKLQSLIKLANYFECTLDYLLGRSDDNLKFNINKETPFNIQFRKVLEETKISQYQLDKERIIGRSSLFRLLSGENEPNINTILKLADYLNVSVDHLVGRE